MVIDSIAPLLAAHESPVLGLDAYGVIYNNDGPFDEIYGVFDHCKREHIPIVMMTNNATQNIAIIEQKMADFGLPIAADHIVSSGCGLIELPDLRACMDGKRAFVYGYPSSIQYAIDAGATVVDEPKNADVIVMAASVGSQNHRVYRDVFVALNERPHVPVICVNPDHYVRNHDGYLAVMGFYANQMMAQLGRSDFIWMGKPYPIFSDLVAARLKRLGYDARQLIFCDDNPYNVHQLTQDLQCDGVVITATGICQKVEHDAEAHRHLNHLSICKI